MQIDTNKLNSSSYLQNGTLTSAVKSDTALVTIDEKYPRGFLVQVGGTLSVWTRDGSDQAIKFDFGEVATGFTWVYGGVFGICETDSSDQATTADRIVWIP